MYNIVRNVYTAWYMIDINVNIQSNQKHVQLHVFIVFSQYHLKILWNCYFWDRGYHFFGFAESDILRWMTDLSTILLFTCNHSWAGYLNNKMFCDFMWVWRLQMLLKMKFITRVRTKPCPICFIVYTKQS